MGRQDEGSSKAVYKRRLPEANLKLGI